MLASADGITSQAKIQRGHLTNQGAVSSEILSYLEQRFGSTNVTFECRCAQALN